MDNQRPFRFCTAARHWVPLSKMVRGKNVCKECRVDYQRGHRARARVRERNEAIRWPAPRVNA